MRALVVEGEPSERLILELALGERGHIVTSVSEAEAALVLHTAAPFPLVVVAADLPGIGGLELCRRMRQAPGGDEITIVVIADRTRSDDLLTALDAGASDYLVKPVDVPHLRTRLVITERLADDIARRKQMQARLLLTDRLASVGTLAAGVAHEINSPLAYVIANLELLAHELPDALGPYAGERLTQLTDMVKSARDGAERVRLTVRDLKTFSASRSEEVGPVDVRRAFELAIQMSWNEIRHRARLVKDYGELPPVRANESRLGQVFLNLLVNAAQAIPEGAADRNEIRIMTRPGPPGRVTIEVRDSGAGIAPELLTRIFDPFFTTKPAGVGTGLGLSICHSIVTALEGEISVDSAAGRGTTFRVVLPVADLTVAAPPRVTSAQSQPIGRRGRVLVIDDEPLIGAAVKRALSAEHDVLALSSSHEALQRFRDGERYDVIICDLMMPALTGMDIHDELVRLAPAQADRMVFITGGAFTSRAQTFLAEVQNPRIEKPFDLHALRALVHQAILAGAHQDRPRPSPEDDDVGTGVRPI
jgi:signal transduction histidine kinase